MTTKTHKKSKSSSRKSKKDSVSVRIIDEKTSRSKSYLSNTSFNLIHKLSIMVAITYDTEIPSSIPAAKVFKAVVLDTNTLIPKIMPQAIKNVEILEGDGGVGTVKVIHFGEGSQYKSVKQRVDAIDTENLTHTYSIIEGDAISDVIESITYHIKIVPTEEGGCIVKNRSIYNTKGDAEVDVEKIKEGKEKASSMFKAIEAYLAANPDY